MAKFVQSPTGRPTLVASNLFIIGVSKSTRWASVAVGRLVNVVVVCEGRTCGWVRAINAPAGLTIKIRLLDLPGRQHTNYTDKLVYPVITLVATLQHPIPNAASRSLAVADAAPSDSR